MDSTIRSFEGWGGHLGSLPFLWMPGFHDLVTEFHWIYIFWSKKSSRPHEPSDFPQMVVFHKGNPLISGKSRLVKYYEPFAQIILWPHLPPPTPATVVRAEDGSVYYYKEAGVNMQQIGNVHEFGTPCLTRERVRSSVPWPDLETNYLGKLARCVPKKHFPHMTLVCLSTSAS